MEIYTVAVKRSNLSFFLSSPAFSYFLAFLFFPFFFDSFIYQR